jgi:hypothetical protein
MGKDQLNYERRGNELGRKEHQKIPLIGANERLK